MPISIDTLNQILTLTGVVDFSEFASDPNVIALPEITSKQTGDLLEVDFSTYRLIIDTGATLNQDPDTQKGIITFGASQASIENRGTFNFGQVTTFNGKERIPKGVGWIIQGQDSSSSAPFNRRYASIYNNGGTVNFNGGVWLSDRMFSWNNNSVVNINNTIFTKVGTNARREFRFGGNTFSGTCNPIIDGYQISHGVALPENFSPVILNGEIVQLSGAELTQTLRNIDLSNNISVDKDFGTDSDGTGGAKFYRINTTSGSDTRVMPKLSNRDLGGAITIAYLDFIIKDSDQNNVNEGFIFIEDVDNGDRKNANGLDKTQTIIYKQPIVSGTTGEFEVELGIVNIDSNNPNTPADFDTDIFNKAYKVDRRFNTEDLIPTTFISYSYEQEFLEVNGRQINTIVSNYRAFLDPNITDTEANVSSYTTVNNVNELYDWIKLYRRDNYENSFVALPSKNNYSNYEIVVDPIITEPALYENNGSLITIKSNSFEGTLETTSDIILKHDSILKNGQYNKVILDSTFTFTGSVLELDNVQINELENLTGNDINISLTNEATVTTLTSTNGNLNIPRTLTIRDVLGDEIKCIVWDSNDITIGNEIYSYNSNTEHTLNLSGLTGVRVIVDKPEHYAKVVDLDLNTFVGDELIVTLDRSPNVDASIDISSLIAATTTEIIEDLYGTFDVFRATINQSLPLQTASQWRRYHDYFTETVDGLTILGLFGLNGNQVYQTTQSGVNILLPSLQVAVNSTENVETQAYIDESQAESLVAQYDYTPRNLQNVKVITSTTNPIIDYSEIERIVIENSSGGSVNLQPILDAILNLNDLSLNEIENSSVVAKETTLTSIVNSIANIPTTDSVADLTPVLTAITNLNDITVQEVRDAFDEVDFKDKNTEQEIHSWLDSYANKDDFKANNIDISTLATKENQQIINNNVKKASLIIPAKDNTN